MKRFALLLLIGVLLMKYPKLGGIRSYDVTVPKLSGGVNTSESPHLINDNQLTDCLNMWWDKGALRSRPGLWTGEDEIQGRYMRKSAGLSSNLVDMSLYVYPIANKYYINRYARYQSASSASTEARVCIFDEHGYFDDFAGGIGSLSLMSPNIPDFTMLLIPVNSSATNPLSQYGAIAFASTASMVYGVASGTFNSLQDKIYIPTISRRGIPVTDTKNGTPNGVIHEAKNMLTPKFKCQFTSNDEGIYYFLPFKDLDNSEILIERVANNGQTYQHTIPAGSNESNFNNVKAVINRNAGYFYFANSSGVALKLQEKGIENNITITASKTTPGAEETICKMTFGTWFGSGKGIITGTRLVVSGNPDYPNLVYFSDVNNPLYFPEHNKFYVGGDSQKITGFGKQGDSLIIFKENEVYRAYDVVTETKEEQILDGKPSTNTTYFTITPIHATIGCDIPNTIQLCANRLVWANSNGKVYTLVSRNEYSEHTVREVSYNIESKLAEHDKDELLNASAADYNGRYYLLIGNKIYVMDYRNGSFQYYASYINDEKTQRNIAWFIWDVGMEGIEWKRIVGSNTPPVLCGVTGYGEQTELINYVFSHKAGYSDITPSGQLEPVNCMFQTKVFDFSNPSVYKSVPEVYLGVGRETTEPTLRITYLTDKGEICDPYELQPTISPADSHTPEYIQIRKLTPRLNRILRFGIRVESDTAMAVDSMEIKYSLFNGGVK